MDGSAQTVDELIMSLIEMGFELEDCQLAIQNGKLTANDAAEWLLSGRKQTAQPQTTTLKLGQPCGSLPLGKVDAIVVSQSTGTRSSTEDLGAAGLHRLEPVGSEEEEPTPLVSRINRNDEQRLFKIKFEEKQREEARRSAQAEKIAKKKAHDEVLRQIKEDRETQKARKVPSGTRLAPEGAAAQDPAGGLTLQSTDPEFSNEPVQPSSCVLQIRLLDGKTLKQSFAVKTLLRDVREFVKGQCSLEGEISFIQPFPRIEFTEFDMNRSLTELKFVPNGSLVVKKFLPLDNDSGTSTSSVNPPLRPPADGRSSVDPSQNQAPVSRPPATVPPPVIPPSFVPPTIAPPSYDWGSGQKLFEDEDENSREADENDIQMNSDNDMDDDNPHPQQLPQPHPPHQHPHFPHQPVWGGGSMQHDWGFGNPLTGQVIDNVTLPHHKQDPKQLAAEAAKKRSNAPSIKCRPSAAEPVDVISLQTVDVMSLRDIMIKYVSRHICSTRNPIVGLQGIPVDLASAIINSLIKEGLLKPKTLQVFISCRMQKIILDSYPYCTNELIRVLRHHTYLKHLSLCSCPLITEKGLQALTGLNGLKFLSLASCRQINDNVIPVLSALPSLVTLILEDTSVTDVGIQKYASSSPPHLQRLDLSRTDITQAVLPSFSSLPSLTTLNLEHSRVTGLSGTQNMKKLRKLNISNTEIVTDAFLCLLSHPTLTALNSSNTCNINGDIALSYLQGLSLTEFQFPNRLTTTDHAMQFIIGMKLSSVDLTNYVYITDVSLQYIGQLTQLRVLRLSNTKITDVGMSFLTGLLDLEELNLDRTIVTNIGASCVRAFTRLKELSLSNTGITNGFLSSGCLNPCIELTKLNISKNKISDKGIACLRLPQLVMLNVDETFIRPAALLSLTGCPAREKVIYRNLQQTSENDEDFD